MRDVIIVGGGPAGSTAGKIIADAGKDVVILERTQSSRGVCGGTIGGFWLEETGSDLPNDVICKKINEVVINSPNERLSIRSGDIYDSWQKSLGYVIDRKKFDLHLQKKAVKAGAEIRHGISYKEYCRSRDSSGELIEVRTSEGVMTTKNLILANGAQPNDPDNYICYQEVIEAPSCMAPFRPEVELWFDSGSVLAGYCWAFKEGGARFRIGAGAAAKWIKQGASPKRRILEFKEERGLDCEVLRKEAGIVGMGKIIQSPRDNVLLIGDRANMASLLLGGGIYPAIVSGKVAGECVVEDKANEFNGRISERMGKWFWLQDISREILGCVDGHDLDKALSIVKEYGASSVRMSKEARRLLSSLGQKIPSLFLKDVRNIFRSVGS